MPSSLGSQANSAMPETYRIKRHFSIVGHSPDIVELRSGGWNPISYTLTDDSGGGCLYQVLSALDGSLSVAALASREDVPQEQLEALLDHLNDLGVLEVGASSALDYYLDTLVPTLRSLNSDSVPPPVLIAGDSDLAAAVHGYLAASLSGTEMNLLSPDDPLWLSLSSGDASWLEDGIETVAKMESFAAWQGRFLIYVSRTMHPVRAQLINRVCLAQRVPWLHATFDGPFLLIGPLFVPFRRACYECLETRVLMNLRGAESYQRYKRAILEKRAILGAVEVGPVLGGVLASHTALEAMNYLATGNSFLISKLLSIYVPTMEFSYNDVLRIPGCPACSPIPEREDTELHFELRSLLN